MLNPTYYSFGPFRLAADGTILLRDGEAIPLTPKALRTLLTLVERAGEVVTKQQLIETVWPDSFVEDTGLSRNISVIRRALGTAGNDCIATVARLGYRFTATVACIDSDPAVRVTRTGVARDRRAPVVGRAAELERVNRAFEGVFGGRGQIVALTGEAGIGKTTIVDSFLPTIEGRCRMGQGWCSERLAGTEPHLPILEALNQLTKDDSRMTQTLARAAPTWLRHVAPRSAVLPYTSERAEHDAKSSERLMWELTTFIEEASAERPLVLVFEDLHWTDVSTVDVLAYLAARIVRLRLLIIITYRHHELALRGHPFIDLRAELVARGQLEEVAVSLLTPEEVREYVLSTSHGEDEHSDVPDLVFKKTEGNPLFMVHLVRYLQQRGRSAPDLNPIVDLPDSLRALIDRLLRGLQPAARQLVAIAAVQGHEFDSATLSRVSEMPAGDVEELLKRLDDIHALIVLDRETTLPDGTLTLLYRFVHVLYQDALNDSITPSKRVAWARRIAEALMLEYAGRTDRVAGQIATLCETGRDYWQASQYFLTATKNATQRFAFREAIELATRGLTCLSSVSTVEQSHVLQRELDLVFARLVPVASVEGYASPAAETISARLVELGEALNDVPATAAALSATWMIRMSRGECLAAKDAGTRLVALARAAHDEVLLMNALMHAQIACHHLGEFAEANKHRTEVVSIVPPVPAAERRLILFDPLAASLAESSRNQWITGHLAGATVDVEAAVGVARELRHPDSLAFALLFRGWLHGYRGDWEASVASTDEGIAIAREADAVQTLAWNRCVNGWAVAHSGGVEEGRQELAEAIEASRAIMGQVALPQFYAMMAEVLLLGSDVNGAEDWVRRAISLMNANNDLYFGSELHRLAGVCLKHQGKRSAALEHLRIALNVGRAQGAKLFELRAALDVAELERGEGESEIKAALTNFPEPEPWPELLRAGRR